MPNTYREETLSIMLRYMNELEKKDRKVYLLLAKKWAVVMSNIEPLIKRLSQLPVMTPDQIFRLALYKEFNSVVKQQLDIYSKYASKVITSGTVEFAELGLASSNEILSLLGVSFNKMNLEAITNMILKTAKDTPLEKILIKRYGENFETVKDILIKNITLGKNPIPTAREINAVINGDLYISTRIARTEMITSFRDTSQQVYINSGIVSSINWIAEPDACPICLGIEDGNPYPLNHVFESHPNCRCAIAPNI